MHGTIGTMDVMDKTGHTSIKWDRNNETEIEIARTTFNELTSKGYRAFRVEGADQKGERLNTFDPTAEKMIMVPQLQGG